MYYLSRAGVPVPAEAPYAAHLNERKEWSYHQNKHQEALKNVTGLVDRRPPKCIDPPVQSIQAQTRRFAVDAKNAEIGRENRKLIDKLTSIARTSGPCAPPGYCGRALPRAPPPAGMATGAQTRSRSLNGNGRRTEQRRVDLENASMVRRILTTKSSFDPIRDERAYQKHKRNAEMLQRLPGKPRSLPPLRSRPNSHPATLRGLEGLLMPGDLQRSMSDGTRKALTCDIPLIPHSSTAPPATFEDPELAEVFSEQAPPLATTSPLPMTSEPPVPGVKPVTPKDDPQMRREWLAPSSEDRADEQDPRATDNTGSLGIQGGLGSTGQAGLLGMSSVSDLQYADDWDENSFTSSGNTSRNTSRALASREPSGTTMSRELSGTSLSRGPGGMGTTDVTGTGLGTTQQPLDSVVSSGLGTTQGTALSSGLGSDLGTTPQPTGTKQEPIGTALSSSLGATREPIGTASSSSLHPSRDSPSPDTAHSEKPDVLGLHSKPLQPAVRQDSFEADLFANMDGSSPDPKPKAGRRRRGEL